MQKGASGPAFAGFEAFLRGSPTRPAVMGVLNVTPDSFSDGGQFDSADAAISAGLRMAAEGAAILDVGGESTRPGAAEVPADEQIDRVVPVVRALAEAGHLVSVDTRHAAVMAAALEARAAVVNDVSGLTHDTRALEVCARSGCGVVLMHMRGTPATMASLAHYDDVVAEVRDALADLRARAIGAGIEPGHIMLDPGIGFAKELSHNVALLRALPDLGRPLLVGVSRKKFLGKLSGAAEPRSRDTASLAAGLFAAGRGALVLRVHDVAGTVQALKVWRALASD